MEQPASEWERVGIDTVVWAEGGKEAPRGTDPGSRSGPHSFPPSIHPLLPRLFEPHTITVQKHPLWKTFWQNLGNPKLISSREAQIWSLQVVVHAMGIGEAGFNS